jgi:hypothetical protein
MFPSSRVNPVIPSGAERSRAGKAGEAGLSNPVELRPANHRACRSTESLPAFEPETDEDFVLDEKMSPLNPNIRLILVRESKEDASQGLELSTR